jgi:hypothetical protein
MKPVLRNIVRCTTASTADTCSNVTMSTTMYSQASSHSPMQPRKDSSDELLARMIAQRLVNSLDQVSLDMVKSLVQANESAHDKQSNHKVADNVPTSLTTTATPESKSLHVNVDRVLRDLLRMKIEDECLDSTHNSKINETSSEVRTDSRRSLVSDKSSKDSQKVAPMDIWHPDFWEDKVDESQDLIEKNEVIARCQESDCKSFDDDCSVSSDVSNLTEYTRGMPANQTRHGIELAQLNSLTASSNALEEPKRANSVTFGQVHMRMYKRCISDNPSCTDGPGVGIDWKYKSVQAVPVDAFEWQSKRQRRSSELVLSRRERENMLRDWGYGDKDIAAAVREIKRVKHHRHQTVTNLGVQRMEEVVEEVKHKLWRKMTFRKSTA